MEDEYYPQKEMLDAKIVQLMQYNRHKFERFSHQRDLPDLPCLSKAENEARRMFKHYPDLFDTLIGNVSELNKTMCRLMDRNIIAAFEAEFIVPVMILRGLIDYAVIVKAFLDSSDKECFLRRYRNGKPLNKLNKGKVDFTQSAVLKSLESRFDGIHKLYYDCCKYVHSTYDHGKQSFGFDVAFEGRFGFGGRIYNNGVAYVQDLGDSPYYYDEECTIVDYAIRINELILSLFEEIESERLYEGGNIHIPESVLW